MRINRTNLLALGVALLACALPAGVAAETADSTNVDKNYAALEARIAQLEAQLNHQAPAMAQATDAPAAAPAAEAPAPPPDPLAGITSVLRGVNLTGLVDVYYGYNANNPAGGTFTEPFSFRRNTFGLNLIELQLDKPVDKTTPLGFRFAFGFGDTINAVNEASRFASAGGDGDASGTQYLKEGYLSYFAPVGKGLQFDVGKFVTPAGAEVIETNQNWNYSRSLLFYNAIPYYHFGVRAKYTFNDKFSITGYATNGWNNIVSTNTGKTGGFSATWNATKKLSITENYLVGPRDAITASAFTNGVLLPTATVGDNGLWNNLTDTVVAYNPTAKLSLVANFDYDNQELHGGHQLQYWGGAGYAKYQYRPKTAFAIRGEYLDDSDGFAFATGIPSHIYEFTGTLEHKFAGHLISRLEYRHDESDVDFFQYGKTGAVSGQDTVKIGMIFVLEPAQ